MQVLENNKPLTVSQMSQDGFYEEQSRSDSDRQAVVLKELAATLSQAAELLEETALLNGKLAQRIKSGIDFYHEVTQFEIRLIRCALRQTNGNQKKAAQMLGIGGTTLNAMIKRHGIHHKVEF